jgi:L-rhamnose-H+ transport protein
MEVYHHATWTTLVAVSLFGFGWGLGSTLFGLGLRRVGMALGMSIILGITAALGSLLPFIVLHPRQVVSRQGYQLIAGTLLVILGVVFCALAGRRREQEVPSAAQGTASRGFITGLVICIFSGILSAMLNFGFVFGNQLQQLTLALGVSPAVSANLIWSLALSAGFVVNAVYCLYLLSKNRTWSLYAVRSAPPGYWFGALLMGLIWFSGIAVYGIGAAALGSLGGILGWPLFIVMIIMAANFWGIVTGEWKGVSRRSYGYLLIGIAILLMAVFVISSGGMA